MSATWSQWPDNGEHRQVLFAPSFHRCGPTPSTDYGIGSVRMLFVLRHEGWAMTWDVFTGWMMPAEAFKAANPTCTHPRHVGGTPPSDPSGGAVDWHSPNPLYEGQEGGDECCWLGGPCYLDSGFILGSDLLALLCTDGDTAVWTRMRELLDERRNEGTSP